MFSLRVALSLLLVSALAGPTALLSQEPLADARALALGGAMVSTAEGIHAVGYNPARLAFSQKNFSMNLGGFTFGIANNMLSVNNYNKINGADFIDPISADYVDKQQFLDDIDPEGWKLNTTLHLPIPVLNWARGTTAYSSEILIYGAFGLPKGFFELMLEGNPIDQELKIDLNEEMIGVIEWGFSFAIPTGNMAFGITLKYLQGLFYLGVDPDSSYGTFITDITGLHGEGRYLFRQAVGGSGFGLDVGFATGEMNGYQFGIALINAVGRIRWQGPSITKDLMGDALQGMMPWGENEYFLYTYEARDVTLMELQGGTPMDSLFIRESYTVFESADSGLVRSEGRDAGDYNLRPFTTDYPSIFRMGGSKMFAGVGRVSLDLTTNFQNSLWADRGWHLAMGLELLAPPSFPVRMGLRYGGKDSSQLGIGFGIHKGPLHFDFAMAFNNGLLIHTAKGMSLALGLTLVR
ncbi:MAG: hypothetical protein IIC41_01030 [Candidatus Marinimicrobia bacterium]|nr:hypothetical protein [Candidatus Neomarinimicrobiota bacterium]